MHVTLINFPCHAMSVGSSRGQTRACHIARFSSARTQLQAIPQFSRQNKDSGSPQASRKDFVSRKTAIVARQIDAERVILTNLTQMQATSLQVLNSDQKHATCCLSSGYAENHSQWHVILHFFLWQHRIVANRQRKSFSVTSLIQSWQRES